MDREKLKILNDIEAELSSRFQKIDEIALNNTLKVLSAFQKEEITNQHFAGTTGYGYTDKGKEGLSKVYADIFETEDAVVTSHLTSGTHAIATCESSSVDSPESNRWKRKILSTLTRSDLFCSSCVRGFRTGLLQQFHQAPGHLVVEVQLRRGEPRELFQDRHRQQIGLRKWGPAP